MECHGVFTMSVIVLCVLQSAVAQFHRTCQGYEDCVFYKENLEVISPFNDPSVPLDCDMDSNGLGNCSCRSAVSLGDRPLFNLKWISGECRIGANGPCGIDNGLRIQCAEPETFKCIGGRCRQGTNLHRLSLGSFCYDTLECSVGLTCQMTKWNYFYTESKCLPPKHGAHGRWNSTNHPVF